MENFKGVKVGDRLVCINSEGWDGDFVTGGVYGVTEVRESEPFIMVGGVLVYEIYAGDFAIGDREGQPVCYQATDFTVKVDSKTFGDFSMVATVQDPQEGKKLPEIPSGYVTKTTHQSVGDVTTTVSYHFEKYEDFQRYEDSLKEEDLQ